MNQEITKEEKKERALSELKELVSQGIVNQDDVLSLFSIGKEKLIPEETSNPVIRTLYFIGGLIIVLGLGVFIAQFWVHWSQVMKVVFALGLSSFFYAVGYYLHSKYQKLSIFSNISFIISAILLPLGVGTFLDLIGIPATTSGGLSINFAILSVSYFVSYSLLKYDIFVIYTAASVSSLFISFTNFLVKDASTTFYEYRFFVLGLALSCFGYYFELYKKHLVNFFYLSGVALLLGSAFGLSTDSTFWLLVFPLILVGAFYASTILRNKLILILATIFTFVEIGRLTSDYFSESLGWPISLIIAGFSIILVAYSSYKTAKKYTKK